MQYIKYLILLGITTNSYAQQITFIDKGSTAPYSGYLFDQTAELKNRKLLLELDYEKQMNGLLNNQLNLYKDLNSDLEKQKNLWKDNSIKLSEDLRSSSGQTFFQSFLFFGLGVLSTTLIVQAVK